MIRKQPAPVFPDVELHDAAKAHFDGIFRGHKAYPCVPPVMIEAAIRTLMQGQLFDRRLAEKARDLFARVKHGLQRVARRVRDHDQTCFRHPFACAA